MATNLSEKNIFGDKADAARQLAVLVDTGLVFSSELSPRVAFEQVLEVLKRRHGVIRGVVTLLDAQEAQSTVKADRTQARKRLIFISGGWLWRKITRHRFNGEEKFSDLFPTGDNEVNGD